MKFQVLLYIGLLSLVGVIGWFAVTYESCETFTYGSGRTYSTCQHPYVMVVIGLPIITTILIIGILRSNSSQPLEQTNSE